jgi:NADH-quinone oxidoreductase subunit N
MTMLQAMSSMLPLLGMLTPPAGAEFMALIPGAIVTVLALLVVLIDSFHRPGTRRDYLAYISAVGMAVAVGSAYVLWDNSLARPAFHGMLYLDKFSLFFAVLAAIAGGVSLLQAPSFLRFAKMDRGEYYMLVLFSAAGVVFMANAADLLEAFLALEVMSIPVYCLAGFLRRDERSAEAALKYFVLGAFSAGLMLYGMALVYGVTGTTNLEYIGINLNKVLANAEAARASGLMIFVGMMLILSGFAFKIAAVPFHVWAPDVYTGSPTPAVGYMSTAVKAGAFAAMLRVLFIAFENPLLRGGFFGLGWVDVLFFLAAASMVLGNVVAIMQSNVKRMLAYSSIAHAGYMLVGVVAAGARPEFFLHNDAVLFYMASYMFGTLGAFGVLSILGRAGRPVETYEDLAGLGIKYPFAGILMGVFMFSSAGVPPTAGFVAKLYIFKSAVDVGVATGEVSFIGLSIVGVLASVSGAYYYLRVLVSMYMRPAAEHGTPVIADVDNGARASLYFCAAMTLMMGILPALGLDLARQAVVDFKGTSPEIQKIQQEGQRRLDALKAAEDGVKAPAQGAGDTNDGSPPQG